MFSFISLTQIEFLILHHKYIVLFPIALFEGHVISLIVGFLSQLGYLNPYISAFIIILGNLTGDVILYWIGFHNGEPFVKRWGKYIGLNDDTVMRSTKLFHAHKEYILFFSKITNGFGLAMAVLFSAGMTKIPFKDYIFWNALGEVVWTGALICLGYFFGKFYTNIENVIFRVGLVICTALLIFIGYRIQKYFYYKTK